MYVCVVGQTRTRQMIVFNSVWNTKACNLGFVSGTGEAFFKLFDARIQIEADSKSKAQKAGATSAARLRANSAQPLKGGGNMNRAAKQEVDTSSSDAKKKETIGVCGEGRPHSNGKNIDF